MKTTEVALPEAVYSQVENLAAELRLTVPEVLRQAADQMVLRQNPPPPRAGGDWQFPAGRHLGAFQQAAEDWRLSANEAVD